MLQVLMGITGTDALLALNALLVSAVIYFLKIGVDVVRASLAEMQKMQINQAVHSEAIERHERALERLLNE